MTEVSENAPLVTAVITTHNRYDLVQYAIESVQKQTYAHIELIVVDNASDEGIHQKLSAQAEEEGFQYIYVSKDESKGVNYCRNLGILNGSGKYIAFLDDDDEWLPQKTEKQVELLEENPDSKVCYCGKINEYNLGEYVKGNDVFSLQDGDLSSEVLIHVLCVTSTLMIDRDLLITEGLFDETLQYWQEYELCMRLFSKTNVSVVREVLVLYRVIYSDDERLTNQIDGWEETVQQIYQKHQEEMSALSKEQLKRRNLFRYRDGAVRCRNSGDRKQQRQYLWKIFQISHNPKDFLRALLNTCSLRNYMRETTIIMRRDK